MKNLKNIDEQVLFEMSFSRSVFINKIQSLLGGALGEFYKAECAKANGLTKWVQHWKTETNRILEIIAIQIYRHPIKGFKDRRKALDKAILEMKEVDSGYRTFAMNTVVRDFKLRKLKYPIPTESTQKFYELLEIYILNAETTPPIE